MQVVCPNCGEAFDLNLEPSEAELIIDCEICCRPMTVIVRVADGEIESNETTPA